MWQCAAISVIIMERIVKGGGVLVVVNNVLDIIILVSV